MTILLQLLLWAKLIGVTAFFLAAVDRPGMQPRVALSANHLFTVKPWALGI